MILSSMARRRVKACARSAVSVTALATVAIASAQAQVSESSTSSESTASEPTASASNANASTANASTASESTSSESTAGESGPSEVVVTGSRIIRNGYEAPTPVSVMGAAELNALNPVNVADAVNTLPAFSNSVTGRSQNGNLSSGSAGVNQLNLRGLGISRTLVLLDGHRVINASGTAGNSAPDINTFPSALVKRVDVVTGGASAAYGSDALSGVVNFVLDHDYTGFKGQVLAGETKYSDDKNIDVQLSYGVPFAGGRGHLLLSGEYAHNDGVSGANGRPWAAYPSAVILNPAYGTSAGKSTNVPRYILSHSTGLAAGMPGGIIVSGPLKGTYFGPNGSIFSGFNFGTPVGNSLQQGGDYQLSRIDNGVDIDGMIDRKVAYLRGSFDFTDNITGYVEGQYAGTHTSDTAAPNRRLGNLTISTDNAYLPDSLRQQLVAAGVTSFTMGSTNGDMGRFLGNYRRDLYRATGGLNGKFDALGTNWKWDAYVQHSQNSIDSRTGNDGITAQYLQAVDSVRVNGVPTCRVNAPPNPNNNVPNCVPYNVFGTGVNTPNQLAYVEGFAHGNQVLKQDVGAANLNGEPFNSWAGPVSTAAGVEHRIEQGSGYATSTDLATGWFAGNYHPTTGKYHVTEGYLETVVGGGRNLPAAQQVDLNAAVRATDYSTSGYVTTWKAGLTWQPIDDAHFRFTRSRDIRAPNLGELFAGGQAGSGLSLNDPFRATNGVPENISNAFGLTKGNPNLKPEVADTTGFGVVFQPRFAQGLQASIDYYNIDIKGSVQAPDAQTIVDLCYQGNQALCQDISRRPLNPGDPFAVGQLFQVITAPQNLIGQKARGIDFETSYRVPLSTLVSSWEGNLAIRGMATRVLKLETTDTSGTVYNGNGVVGSWAGIVPFSGNNLTTPKLRGLLTVEYQLNGLTATVIYHYIGPGVYGNGFIDCTTNCPVSTTAHPTFGNNHIGGQQTIDLTGAYKFVNNLEVFATIENLTNRQPPDVGNSLTSAYWQDQANSDYERIGRQYRIGFRFDFK